MRKEALGKAETISAIPPEKTIPIVRLQAFYELFKGIVFALLGIMVLLFGPQYLSLPAWQRWGLGIALIGYAGYKFYLVRKYQRK
ncbi:MAG: hypothetical protein AAFQ98_21385 [Bacteroidota bacterium]